MATTACPKCGQPLRPGVRFCGNCGSPVSVGLPQAAAAQVPQAGDNLCPHCGKPVRSGAKFCSNCGKVIEQPAAQPVSPQKVEPASAGQAPPPAQAQAVRPVLASSAVAKAAPASQNRKSGRALWVWLGVLVLVIVCILVPATGYLLVRNHFFGLIKTPSSSPTPQVTVSSNVTPKATEAQHTKVPPTSVPSPKPTKTEAPAGAPTALPPTAGIPTVALSPTAGVTVTLSTPQVLFFDEFNSDLNNQWKVWGDPRPKISRGPGDNWLDLAVSETLGSAGITSKQELKNEAGVEFIIKGQLNTSYSQYALYFDWDPVQVQRGPGNIDPGIIHLEIQKSKAILETPLTKNQCSVDINGSQSHTYRLRIAGRGVELVVDNQPACGSPDMGLASTSGRISFTGIGWITRVDVVLR